MTDYSKLKVVDLKAELKSRGLVQTGVKQILIDRLTEADSQVESTQAVDAIEPEAIAQSVNNTTSEQPEEARHLSPILGAHIGPDATADARTDAASPVASPENPLISTTTEPTITRARHSQHKEVRLVDNDASAPTELEGPSTEQPTETLPPALSTQSTNIEEVIEDSRKRKRRSLSPVPSSAEASQKKAKQDDGATRVRLQEDLAPTSEPISQPIESSDTLMGDMGVADSNQMVRDDKLPDVDDHEFRPDSIQDDISPEESNAMDAVDDNQEPSADIDQAVSKSQARGTGETTYHDAASETIELDAKQEAQETISTPTIGRPSEDGTRDPALEKALTDEEPSSEKLNAPEQTPPSAKSPPVSKDTPSKTKDTRFKDLFSGPAKESTRDKSPPASEQTAKAERDIPPAVHPATRALYIRDLSRPLQAATLKSHLISLATPHTSTPNPSILQDFYLDPIRSHCLASFSSISAASRVRAGLHDCVWPDERTRKPLWVDFIPEDKIGAWIETEENSADSNRGSKAIKWEICYERVDGGEGVQAVLRKEGSTAGGGANVGMTVGAGMGVRGAPLGPRGERDNSGGGGGGAASARLMAAGAGAADRNKPSHGNVGFGALDSLFRCTAAKPKLYFLPVGKEVVEKRSDMFGKLRSVDRRAGDEMRRYTFDARQGFVDKGPEFGIGYRGRGGRRRGDGWVGDRGRGDGWVGDRARGEAGFGGDGGGGGRGRGAWRGGGSASGRDVWIP